MWRDWQPGHSGDILGRYLIRSEQRSREHRCICTVCIQVARADASCNQSINDGLSICKICESISAEATVDDLTYMPVHEGESAGSVQPRDIVSRRTVKTHHHLPSAPLVQPQAIVASPICPSR